MPLCKNSIEKITKEEKKTIVIIVLLSILLYINQGGINLHKLLHIHGRRNIIIWVVYCERITSSNNKAINKYVCVLLGRIMTIKTIKPTLFYIQTLDYSKKER